MRIILNQGPWLEPPTYTFLFCLIAASVHLHYNLLLWKLAIFLQNGWLLLHVSQSEKLEEVLLQCVNWRHSFCKPYSVSYIIQLWFDCSHEQIWEEYLLKLRMLNWMLCTFPSFRVCQSYQTTGRSLSPTCLPFHWWRKSRMLLQR